MNPGNCREKWEKQEQSMKMVIAVFDKSKALMILLRGAECSNLLNYQHFQHLRKRYHENEKKATCWERRI
jgi:hypothetical protein